MLKKFNQWSVITIVNIIDTLFKIDNNYHRDNDNNIKE